MDGNDSSGGNPAEQSAEPGTTEKIAPEAVREILDIIQLADSKTASPDERAKRVWDALKSSPDYDKLTTWDIVCFAGNGVAMFHTFHPWLEDAAKNLAKIMHTIHYANWESIAQEELDVEIAKAKMAKDN
jgi:hypothetical protein